MSLAPIALFVYKRPNHTRQTLEALAECALAGQSKLFIFSDGPKTAADEASVAEVRRIAKERAWCGEVDVVEQERNRGLAASVIGGVTDLCEKYGRVIVLEDDLVVAPNFLTYMNEALDRYVDEPSVMQISGHMFDVELVLDDDAVFMPFVSTWGWATWSRAWAHFDPDMSGYEKLRTDAARRKRFNLGGAYDYFDLLERQRSGAVDSWGIRWNLSVFDSDGIVLYPKKSLVDNRGFDGSGTHCSATDGGSSSGLGTVSVERFPQASVDARLYAPVLNYLRGNTRRSRIRRMAAAALRTLGLRKPKTKAVSVGAGK